jgi:CheY-like chemotaxis protein
MRPHLLLVEDDEDSRDLLTMLLESCGFATVGAGRTSDARQRLEQTAFDVVLADFMVDSHDPAVSWNAIDELVRIAKPSPVGLLTGWPIKPEQADAHDLAFVLPKPCSSEMLLARLGALLDVPPLAMPQEQAIRDYFTSLAAGDYARLVAGCTEDVIYHLPSADPKFGNTARGRDAFLELSRSTFERFREPAFEILEIRPLPRGVIVRYVGSWLEADGRKAMPGAVLFVLEHTEIAEIGVRVDLSRLHALAS